MVFAHGGLKVRGGQLFGTRLMRAPLQAQAVADAAEQPGDEHTGREPNSAAVVIVRNVQPLVEAVFDASKASSVQREPLLRVEFFRLGAGQQADVLVLATVTLAEQSGGLCHQGKTDLFGRDRLGQDRTARQAALVVLQRAELSRRRLPRGGNPP